MKLAVIVPTYDNLEGLQKLVGQVYEHTPDFQLYLVDNGRKGGTVAWLKSLDRENLKVILHHEDKGIAGSWNDGLQAALEDDCTHFAVFNDDIELCEGWWEACRAEFEKGAHMVCLDQPCPIELTGWFFVLSKTCVERIGLFDEQFTLTSEDTDYLYRFQDAGLKLTKVHLPIIHNNGGSTTVKKLDREKFKEIRLENWEKLRRKYPHRRMPSQR